jgi:uncharacterized cupin superfamily protein
MPKIDLDAIPQVNRTGYPVPFNTAVQGRWYRRLAPAAGLSAMGVSQVVLKPGAWSSQRHWHAREDEFLVIVSGEAVLVEDDGEIVLRPGDCAAFPMGVTDGHHLQNRADTDCVFVVMSAGPESDRDYGEYPDIDMRFTEDDRYVHKDGTPY